jgi:hypothetical protein
MHPAQPNAISSTARQPAGEQAGWQLRNLGI